MDLGRHLEPAAQQGERAVVLGAMRDSAAALAAKTHAGTTFVARPFG